MDDEKHIDESWKSSVEGQRNQEPGLLGPDGKSLESEEAEPQNQEMPQLNFINYITSLAFQTMIFLGEIPNPITEKIEKNLMQAKFLIDTLALLREKTTGNLTPQESEALNSFVYELQTKFVEVAQKEGQQP